MSETVRQVVEAVVANRERFEAFCRSLTEEQLGRPVPESEWIVRDFAAHLGTLDVEFERWFGAVAAGSPLDSSRSADGAAFDIDAYNDAHVAERRQWPFERVLAEAADLRACGPGDDRRLVPSTNPGREMLLRLEPDSRLVYAE